jgi:hypothetical protein
MDFMAASGLHHAFASARMPVEGFAGESEGFHSHSLVRMEGEAKDKEKRSIWKGVDDSAENEAWGDRGMGGLSKRYPILCNRFPLVAQLQCLQKIK